MTQEQLLPALIAHLVDRGVEPRTIEDAVAVVCDLKPGRSITPRSDPLLRAFAWEQASRLVRSL